MRLPFRNRLLVVSVLMVGPVLAVWGASYWRSAGRARSDEAWVITGAMRELHTTVRTTWITRGRFEVIATEVLSAVIPAGSIAAGEPNHESHWIWQRSEQERVRTWESRWRLSSWNEWRLGDLGWYHTTGGGQTARVISVPLWIPLALAGTPCWIGVAKAVRSARRQRHGRCVACGYDRGGLTPAAACPECGARSGTQGVQ